MSVYSPWVFSEGRPDTSSLDRFVKSAPFADKKNEDFAVEVWKYFSSSEVGVFHYCPPVDEFRGRESHDVIKILNCFGFAICHIHAHIMSQVYRAAGYETRIANITGHEGTEIFYEDGWHYLDCDLKGYSRRHPPEEHIIASREDFYEDLTIITEQQNPSEPIYYVEDRPPETIARLAAPPPTYLRPFDELLHSMDFVLRPGERIIRKFGHDNKWIIFPEYRSIWKRYSTEPGAGGPEERFEPHRRWGNGDWIYAPDLSENYADLEEGALAMRNLARTADGVQAMPGREPGEVIFDFDIPYPIAGIPDIQGILSSHSGAILKLRTIRAMASDAIQVKLSFDDGRTFAEVWDSFQSHGPDAQEVIIDLTPFLERKSRFQLLVSLWASDKEGSRAALHGIEARFSFMNSPWVLPAVRSDGSTRMSYHAYDKHGQATLKNWLEIDFGNETQFKAALHSSENMTYDPASNSKVIPADPEAGPYSLVFQLKAPAGGNMAWLYANSLWEGCRPDEEVTVPGIIEVRDGEDGDWVIISEILPDPHPQGWHFIKGAEHRLSGACEAVYVRFSGNKGIGAIRIAGHYIPSEAVKSAENEELVITHSWRESGEEKTHTETISPGTNDYDYAIEAGSGVENISYSMEVPSRKR